MCTSRVLVVTSSYGSYQPYSNNEYRGATVSSTEVSTEMIHSQLESRSSSIWLAYPNLSHPRRKVLLASRTCVINTEKKCRQKTKSSEYGDTKTCNLPAERNGLIHCPPGSNYLFCSIDAVPRCCRPIGSFAKPWRAPTCVVVV